MTKALGARGRSRRHEAGYNLVILVMAVTVMNIMVASALPVWSHLMQRQKEQELIFRGLQYAEAIRIFQQRFGRQPQKLEELVESEPRSIRQLWRNPMSEDGRWGLVIGNLPTTGQQQGEGQGRRGRRVPRGQQQQQQQQRQSTGFGAPPNAAAQVPRGPARWPGEDSFGSTPSSVTTGPILGVFHPDGGEAIKTFMGSNEVADWRFTVDLLAGTQNRFAATTNVPTPTNAANIGRPFPPGVIPPMVQAQQGADARRNPQADSPQGPRGNNRRGNNPRNDSRRR